MSLLLGMLLAIGVLLCASPWLWPAQLRARTRTQHSWLRQLAAEAGAAQLRPGALIALSIALAVIAAAVTLLVTAVPAFALLAALAASTVPISVLRSRRTKRAAARRMLWPDVCDLLVASVRSGMSLPDAVAGLADAGPEPLRADFAAFRADFTASGSFDACASRLKDRLADATADRIIETLRMARQVGGTELPAVLRSLSRAVRAEAAVRGEVLARQSWIRGAAVIGVIAPWVILALMLTRPEGLAAYSQPAGIVLVIVTAVISAGAYRIMLRIGSLPPERRWFT